MLLSAELVEHLRASLGGASDVSMPPVPAAAPAAPQRRREPRVGVRARVTVIPLTDAVAAAPFDATVRDFSAGGIGFYHADRLPLDAQFVALIPGGRESMAILCRVAYYQPLPGRGYSVGAKFDRILRQPSPQLDAIPLPATPAPAPLRAAS